jgi:hypothetical protein
MIAAIIINNKIDNLIEISDDFFNSTKDNFAGGYLVDVTDKQVGVNYHYLNDSFYPPTPSNEEQKTNRKETYVKEVDPLFFKWQRGEIERDIYEKEVLLVKERYPYFYNANGSLNIDFLKNVPTKDSEISDTLPDHIKNIIKPQDTN